MWFLAEDKMTCGSSSQGDAEHLVTRQAARGVCSTPQLELMCGYQQVPFSTWATDFSDRGKLRGCQAEARLHFAGVCQVWHPFASVQTFPGGSDPIHPLAPDSR